MSASAKAGLALFGFVMLNALLFLFSNQYYLWAKSFHIISMVSWMAGLFYLPRLYVYHSDAAPGSDIAQVFEVMERRLIKVIMTPAMILTWVFGFYLVAQLGDFPLWLGLKILGVMGLTGFHLFLASAHKKIKTQPNYKTSRQWRLYNEIPTILMFIIVILVVVKPFL